MNFISIRKENLFILILAFVFWIGGSFLHYKNPKPKLNPSKQETAINLNIEVIKFFSLGQKRLISSLLWVQTLMESDLDHYKEDDLNNWMYLRFKTISELDPKFYENYLYGGMYLSIIKDDPLAAEEIFNKGIFIYSHDYKLNYYSGMNAYLELQNFELSISRLEKIQYQPQAPIFLPSIVNKLKLQGGLELETVYQLVQKHYEQTQDETLKERLFLDLYSLKAQIDLKCLNAKNNISIHCNYYDLEGEPYVKERESYKSQKPIKDFKIFINKNGASL